MVRKYPDFQISLANKLVHFLLVHHSFFLRNKIVVYMGAQTPVWGPVAVSGEPPCGLQQASLFSRWASPEILWWRGELYSFLCKVFRGLGRLHMLNLFMHKSTYEFV